MGGHLNCVYGGAAGGAVVMSALDKLNKVDRRLTEANNSDLKAGKKSEWASLGLVMSVGPQPASGSP